MKNKIQFIMINILLMGSCALSIVPKSDVIQKEEGLLLLAGDSDDDYFAGFLPFKKNNFKDISVFLQQSEIECIDLTVLIDNCQHYSLFDLGEDIKFNGMKAKILPIRLHYTEVQKNKKLLSLTTYIENYDIDGSEKRFNCVNSIAVMQFINIQPNISDELIQQRQAIAKQKSILLQKKIAPCLDK